MDRYQVVNYIAYAIPVFFVLGFIELLVSVIIKKKVYRFSDSINDLSMGLYMQMITLFYRGFFLVAYIYIYENYRWMDTSASSKLAWVLGFLAVDFLYYWFHRSSHQVALIWGSHEPHHQSEEYNLSVALRQGSFQGIFSYPFYFPLALLGLHPIIFMVCSQFNTLYQFWIHTRLINRMGVFGWLFNTPSHHRVHHGINAKYIDKNHAGTLIIWDRLFGSFVREEEEPVYGTVKPLTSLNPSWANIQYWLHLSKFMLKVRGLDKMKLWFKPPGWKPSYLGLQEAIPEVDVSSFVKYDPKVARPRVFYVLLQFLITIWFAVEVIFMGQQAISEVGGLVNLVSVLISLFSLGWILEERRGYIGFELLRLTIIASIFSWLYYINPSEMKNLIKVGLLVVSLLLFFVLQSKKE